MNRVRTIYTIFHKEFIQTMRYPTWLLSLVIWPLIFPLAYVLSAVGMAGPDRSGFAAFNAQAGTSNYVGFIVIGTMAWMWVNITMWTYGTFLREEQMRGTLESNWLCPINKFDLLIGGGVMPLLQSLVITIVSIVEYRFIYGVHFGGNLFAWLILFLTMIPGVFGFGMLFASLILWAKDANAAVNVARGIMMMLCGITFPISVMPSPLQCAARFLPFTYGIEASRKVMLMGGSLKSAGMDIFFCIIEGMVLVLLGAAAFNKTQKIVKNSGSLERF